MSKKKIHINDGFSSELVIGAKFEGILEIPALNPAKISTPPKYLVPFSRRRQITDPSKAYIVFYENDDNFTDVIRNPLNYIDEFSKYAGVISPDNSLYRDTPFMGQLANIYRNRAVGHVFQYNGLNVVGNCRWGDERTYSNVIFGEPPAFVGLPKNSVVAVGTYGCLRDKENRRHFKNGLYAMIEYLKPKTILVYGNMPDSIFGPIKNKVRLVRYDNWLSICRKGGRNGERAK